MKIFIVAEIFFVVSVFVLNFVTLIHYSRMANFFIDLLQDNRTKRILFKIMIWLVFGIIVISNGAENLTFPIIALLQWWDVIILTSA